MRRSFGIFWLVSARETRNVPVNSALRCHLRNGTPARGRQAAANPIHHRGPLCEHSCGGGEGPVPQPQWALGRAYSAARCQRSNRPCGYISLSSMRDSPDPDRIPVRSVDRDWHGRTPFLAIIPSWEEFVHALSLASLATWVRATASRSTEAVIANLATFSLMPTDFLN